MTTATATTNATSVCRYINNLTGELRSQGYTSEITRFEKAKKYGPWTLHLAVTSRRGEDTACVFVMDIDPADGEGLSAEIPRLDVDFPHATGDTRARRMQVRDLLARALSDSESGDDFYDYGYNYLMVADAMVTVMRGLTVAC